MRRGRKKEQASPRGGPKAGRDSGSNKAYHLPLQKEERQFEFPGGTT